MPDKPRYTLNGRRRCCTCKRWMPLDAEHFYWLSGASKFGFQAKCKACQAAYLRAYAQL